MNQTKHHGRSIYLAVLYCLMMVGLSAAVISASSPPAGARAGSPGNNAIGCGASAQMDGLVKPGLPGRPQSAQKKGGGGGGSPVRCRIITPTVGDNSTYSCVPEGRGCPGQRQCVLIRVGTTDGYCDCQ